MPHRRFDWHEHIKDIEGEYQAVRIAVDRMNAQVDATPDFLTKPDGMRAYLRNANEKLEGTYLVRLFAALEAALRSYDRARRHDPGRDLAASILIDTISGRRGQGISTAVRDGAHAVRQFRNYWAHKNDVLPDGEMTIAQARARLQTYLSWLPEQWG